MDPLFLGYVFALHAMLLDSKYSPLATVLSIDLLEAWRVLAACVKPGTIQVGGGVRFK